MNIDERIVLEDFLRREQTAIHIATVIEAENWWAACSGLGVPDDTDHDTLRRLSDEMAGFVKTLSKLVDSRDLDGYWETVHASLDADKRAQLRDYNKRRELMLRARELVDAGDEATAASLLGCDVAKVKERLEDREYGHAYLMRSVGDGSYWHSVDRWGGLTGAQRKVFEEIERIDYVTRQSTNILDKKHLPQADAAELLGVADADEDTLRAEIARQRDAAREMTEQLSC